MILTRITVPNTAFITTIPSIFRLQLCFLIFGYDVTGLRLSRYDLRVGLLGVTGQTDSI